MEVVQHHGAHQSQFGVIELHYFAFFTEGAQFYAEWLTRTWFNVIRGISVMSEQGERDKQTNRLA